MSLRSQSALADQRERADPDLAIRVATGDDVARLAAARIAFYQTQIAAGWLDFPADLDEWVTQSTSGIIRSPRNCVILVGDEAELAGYVFAVTKIVPGVLKPAVASIEEIFVQPCHRGLGLAGRLFDRALSDVTARGADRVQLRILAENTPARRFWSGLGFRENVVICELERARHDRSTLFT